MTGGWAVLWVNPQTHERFLAYLYTGADEPIYIITDHYPIYNKLEASPDTVEANLVTLKQEGCLPVVTDDNFDDVENNLFQALPPEEVLDPRSINYQSNYEFKKILDAWADDNFFPEGKNECEIQALLSMASGRIKEVSLPSRREDYTFETAQYEVDRRVMSGPEALRLLCPQT